MKPRTILSRLKKLAVEPDFRRTFLAGLRYTWSSRKIATADGATFEVPPDMTDIMLAGQVCRGLYEYGERELVKRWVAPEDRVIELGGCLGFVSVITNKQLARPDQHVVLEANPELAPVLERNRDRNDARFAVIAGALSPHPELAFRIAGQAAGSSRFVNQGTQISVPGHDWSALRRKLDGEPTCLICDIEGAETEVMPYLAEAAFGHLRTILVEMHPHLVGAEAIAQLRRTLCDHGFSRRAAIGDVEAYQR